MELLLLVITVVSLAVAFLMSAAAWRLSREERGRSAARVAALAAAAASEAPEHSAERPADSARLEPFDERQGNVLQEPRAFRSPAPTAVGPAPWASPRRSAARAFQTRAATDDLPIGATGDVFLGSAVTGGPSSGRQRGLAVAAIVLFVVLVTGGYLTIYDGDSDTIGSASAASTTSPLELVSLRHERKGTRLAITGLVRNPSSGAPVENLSAVVLLFDGPGRLVTSARAAIDFTRLTAGDESPFVVAVDAPRTVTRYRVSFRNDAGLVAHVDRRGEEPLARELP